MMGVTGKESGQDASLTTEDRVETEKKSTPSNPSVNSIVRQPPIKQPLWNAAVGAGVTGLAVGAGVGVGLVLIKTSQGSPAEDHHRNTESISSQGGIPEPASIAPGTSLSYASSELDTSIQTDEGIAPNFNNRLNSDDEGHGNRDDNDTDEERNASSSETQDMGNHHSTGDDELHQRDDEH